MEMDPYKRSRLFKEALSPDTSKERIMEIAELLNSTSRQTPVEEEYEDVQRFLKNRVSNSSIEASCEEEQFSGSRIEANYKGKRIPYFVTESWMNAKMLRVDTAYRIFEEDEKAMSVRKVQNSYELESIAKGMEEHIIKLFDR